MFKLSKRPKPIIEWGLLQQESEKEIQDWLKYNMRKFLLEGMHIPVGNVAPFNKELERFCEDIYTEIHDVGYSEGYDSAQCDSEGEGL